MSNLGRRSFLKIGAGVAAVPLITSRTVHALTAAASPVTITYHAQATTWSGRADGVGVGTFGVNQANVNIMVDQGIKAYTGQSSVGAAWQKLLTDRGLTVTTSTKVGIKINNAYDLSVSGYTNARCPYGCRAETINAIAAGLTQMLGGTFPIENVTVFDKWVYHFASAPDPDNTKLAFSGFPSSAARPYDVSGAGKYRTVLMDPRQPSNVGADSFTCGVKSSVTQKMLPTFVAQNAWINVCIPKVNIGAGITGCMKNTYGLTNDCGNTHDPVSSAPGIHDCVPAFYKALNARRPCLINIMDGLAGNYDEQAFGGPSFIANEMAFSTDPVALDVYVASVVNRARRANRLNDIAIPPTSADRYTLVSGASYPGTLNADGYPNAHSIAVAASAPHSLGSLDITESRVDVTGVEHRVSEMLENAHGRPGAVVRTSAGYRLEVALDHSGRTHEVSGRVLGLDGREVRSFVPLRTHGAIAGIEWDGRAGNGLSVSSGAYCWEVTVDGRTYTQPVHVTR